MNLPFHGRYDQATVNEAVALATQPARWNTLLRWGLFLVYLPIFIYLALPLLQAPASSAAGTSPLFRPLLVLILLLAFAITPYLNTFRLARGLWRQPSIQGDRSGAVTAKGIAFPAHDGERVLEWSQFTRRRQTPDLIVLVTAKGGITIFPRRFFADDEAWGRFQQQVEQKVEGESRKRT